MENAKAAFIRRITSTPESWMGYAWMLIVYMSLVISITTIIYHLSADQSRIDNSGIGLSAFIFSLWASNFLMILQTNIKSSSFDNVARLIEAYDKEEIERKKVA